VFTRAIDLLLKPREASGSNSFCTMLSTKVTKGKSVSHYAKGSETNLFNDIVEYQI